MHFESVAEFVEVLMYFFGQLLMLLIVLFVPSSRDESQVHLVTLCVDPAVVMKVLLIQSRPSTTRLVIRRIGCNAVDRAFRFFCCQGGIC